MSSPLHTVLLAGGEKSPEAPVFLVVHGTMDRASTFRRVASYLEPCQVIGYDRRGYAGSVSRGLTQTFDDQVDDLLEVVGHRKVIGFGHSYGGVVLLTTASRHPELFSGIVAWETPRSWMEYWPTDSGSKTAVAGREDPEAAAEGFMRHVIGDRIWERLPHSTRTQRRSEGPAMLADFEAVGSTPMFHPEQLQMPVTVGYGGKAKAHHVRNAVELAAGIPQGREVTFSDAGHNAHLSHPEAVAGLLKDMARRVDPGHYPWAE